MNFGPFSSSILAVCVAVSASPAAEDLSATYWKEIEPLLDVYCADCHSDGVAKGEFSFEDFDGVVADNRIGEKWHEVINVLNEGRMPPEEELQPEPDEKVAVVSWVGRELDRAEKALAGSGRGVLRRLNRREYEATLEDFFGVPPVGSGAFARDGKVDGLDNQGQGLFMSPYQMDRYLDVALATLKTVVPDGTWKPLVLRLEGEDMEYEPHDFVFAGYRKDPIKAHEKALAKYEALPPDERAVTDPPKPPDPKTIEGEMWGIENDPPIHRLPGRGTVLYHPINSRAQLIIAGAKLMVPLEVPQDGWYRVRVRAGAGEKTRYDKSTLTVGLYEFIEGRGGAQNRGHNPLFREEVRGTMEEPGTIEKLVFLPAGSRRYYLHKGNLGWETEVFNHVEMWQKLYHEMVPRHEMWRGLLVESIEIEGPVTPERTEELFGAETFEAPFTREKMEAALGRLAERAFRRPVAPDELESYLRFFRDDSREGFVDGLRKGAAMILSSPKFVYLVEESAEDDRLSLRELAARLSFFLWSQGPDEELRALAESGALAEEDVLRGQVRRLLDDPRSSRFVRAFAMGWFGLDRLENITPDRRRYPRYTFDMPETLVDQTAAFVERVLRDDRSALEVIDSDWDMLNSKLARYHGLDHLGIEGTRLRPVELKGRDRARRGGVLAHASILTMTSNGTRTSPIVRGAWLVDHLLGRPAPPPPPSVSALEDAGVEDIESISVKQLIELHKRNPDCAACHKHFDPYGVAFENYDAAGQWQDFNIKFVDKDKFNKDYLREPTGPIDASGVLPDGTEFSGPQAMKRHLLERKDDFSRNLVSKLLSYAVGRPVEFSDRSAVRDLQAKFVESDHRLAPLIEEIVVSKTFSRR